MPKRPSEASVQEAEKTSSFEQGLAELEELLAKLEGGSLSPEEQVACYERGLELVKRCRTYLEAAATRISQVLEGPEGEPELTDFEANQVAG